MDILKKRLALLLAALLCLTACAAEKATPAADIPDLPTPVSDDEPEEDIGGGEVEPDDPPGADWRAWGIIQSDGTIRRDGEETYVLVCVNQTASNFYYDDDSQIFFDGVEFPFRFGEDVWGLFEAIDFSDRSGDGNSDVTMYFHGNVDCVLVWYWDAENACFVYQEEASQTDGFDPDYVIPEKPGPAALTLVSDALPAYMERWNNMGYGDGLYYEDFRDPAGNGEFQVVSTAIDREIPEDETVEDYLVQCAFALEEAVSGWDFAEDCVLESVTQDAAYTNQMTYPVYIARFSAGGNEDYRQWIVFAMNTDTHTYLYALRATAQAEEDIESLSEEIFAGLHLSDTPDT